MRKINIALIGYKFMGKAHSNAWRQVGSFFNAPFEPVLKVICGREEAGVKEAADRFGWPKNSTSWEKGIGGPDMYILDICAPGDTHMPIAVAAAEAKKVIFCEKPL